jgi:hypothetical protein
MENRIVMNINKIGIFRITHIDNLDYILRVGKITRHNSKDADAKYIGIGDNELIGLRHDHTIVTVDTQKTCQPSSDYLPFYLAPRSVMLYRIATGYNVKKVSQENIVHLVFRVGDIADDVDLLFTDGHGYAKITAWFESLDNLDSIDWKLLKERWWNNTEDDNDRERRRQAEFWIKNELSLDRITGIGVYNEEAKAKVEAICQKYGRDIKVKVQPSYYY